MKTGIFDDILGTGSKVIFFLMHIFHLMQIHAGFGIKSGLIVCGVFILCPHWGRGAEVTYLGSETGSPGNDYSVQNWSNPGVAKAWNVSTSEVYGSSGYIQIRPTSNSTNLSEPTASGNNFGVGASTNPSLLSKPFFIGSQTGGAGTFVNFGGYSTYRGPDGSTIYRQGGLSLSVNNGPFDSPTGPNASYFGIAMSFTLSSSVKFRLGVAIDSVGSGEYAPNYVSISGVFSEPLTRDGNSDMVFFDIEGSSGESFDVALWQNSETQSVAVLSLVTFDEIQSDTTPPFIELNGPTSVSIDWGGSYTDEGATATDDVDSVVTVMPSGAVNTSKPGVYTITFDATDAAGNAATQVVRTVTVSAPSGATGADGLSELMRYALGGNAPGDSVAKTSSSVTGEYLVISAIVRTDDSNLTVVGEAVTDLDNYASGTSVVEVQGVDAADQGGLPIGSKRRTFSVALDESDTKKFLRLKASLAQ